MARGLRIYEIAEELGFEVDECLVTLWDAGIEEYEDPDAVIPHRDLKRVRRGLGIASHKERLTVDYWVRRTDLDRQELTRALREVGLELSPKARRIPKGGLRKLSKLFPEQTAPVEAPPDVPDLDPEIPLEWQVVGQTRDIRLLTIDEITGIHETLTADFAGTEDPIFPPGVRDFNLLSSAVGRSGTSFENYRKYPSVEMACAALFHSMIHNHPFHNGNKRTALVSLLAQLDENGLVLTANEDELFRFTLRTAQHRLVKEKTDRPDREVLEIARWIRARSRPVERGELPMRWGRLKQRLRDFGCDCVASSSVGNRINVTRRIEHPRRFGRAPRIERLSTQVAWSGDGTDADRNTVHKIRRDLKLDDANNVDSATFYRGVEVDAFIAAYRKILQRLAKL